MVSYSSVILISRYFVILHLSGYMDLRKSMNQNLKSLIPRPVSRGVRAIHPK